MKSYFNFSFLGWVYSVDPKFYKTKNGFEYQKIRVVNGTQFNLFFIFEDSKAFAKISKGDKVILEGSIDRVDFGSNYFKVERCEILAANVAIDHEPSSDEDIKRVLWEDAEKGGKDHVSKKRTKTRESGS